MYSFIHSEQMNNPRVISEKDLEDSGVNRYSVYETGRLKNGRAGD